MLPRIFGVFGCGFAFAFVMLSALSAHAFTLDASNQQRLNSALVMLIVHAFALLLLRTQPKSHEFAARLAPALALAGLSFLLGTLLFCGSLLLAVLVGFSAALKVAPAGGMLLMLGWALFALSIWRAK